MNRRTFGVCGLIAVAVCALGPESTYGQSNEFGQTIINGPTAGINAGSAGARAPGNMVASSLVRASQQITPLSRPDITETSRPPGPLAQTLPDAIDTAFTELNTFMLFLFNQLLQRQGLPPLVPGDIITPSDGTSTGDGRNPRGGTK